MSDRLNLKVKHPDFGWVYAQGVNGFPVVVFERKEWKPIAQKTLEKYRADKKIVEAHGGRMVKHEIELAKPYPKFNTKDVAAMIAAVKKDLAGYEILDSWNGRGLYTFSVSIRKIE